MAHPSDKSTPLILADRDSRGERIFILLCGLICVFLPVWEFLTAFIRPNWGSIFFFAIIAGAWSVGLPLIYAALWGPSKRWRFEGDELNLTLKSPFRGIWRQKIVGQDIADFKIRTIDWDGKADSFSVVLYLKSGATLETPDMPTRQEAEVLLKEMRGRLDF